MERSPTSIICIDHWLSVDAYAALCRVQPRTIYLRMKRGAITGIMIDGILVIDAERCPPSPIVPSKTKAARFQYPASMPALDHLAQMRTFCERKRIRGHALYAAIIAGKLKGWLFADQLFIDASQDLRAYIKHR